MDYLPQEQGLGWGRKRKARLNSGLGAKELHATARDKYLGEGRVKVWKGIKELRNNTRAVFSGLAIASKIIEELIFMICPSSPSQRYHSVLWYYLILVIVHLRKDPTFM